MIVKTSSIGNLSNKIAENVFVVVSQNINNNSSQLLTYKNDTYGVNIRDPISWNSSPREGNDKTGDSSIDIVSFSPKDTISSATFDVSFDSVHSGENLKQFVSDPISDDKTDLKNFKINESSSSENSLAGNPTYKMLYSYTDQGENIMGLETGTLIGNEAYFIQYENSPAQFDSNLRLVWKMIDSLNITNSKNSG